MILDTNIPDSSSSHSVVAAVLLVLLVVFLVWFLLRDPFRSRVQHHVFADTVPLPEPEPDPVPGPDPLPFNVPPLEEKVPADLHSLEVYAVAPTAQTQPQSQTVDESEIAFPLRDDDTVGQETIRNLARDTLELDTELAKVTKRTVSAVYATKDSSQLLAQYLVEHLKELGFTFDAQDVTQRQDPHVLTAGVGIKFSIGNETGRCLFCYVTSSTFSLVIDDLED